MKKNNHYFTLLLFVLILCCASCGKPKLKSNPDEADSIAIVTEKEAKSSSEKSAFPQITAFTDMSIMIFMSLHSRIRLGFCNS